MQNEILQWDALEFEHHEKGIGWYLTLIILGVMIIAYYILSKDYFGALTWFVIFSVVYLYARQKPAEVQVTLHAKGVKINDIEFPYTQIKRFWIVDKDKVRSLHLETTAYLNRVIVILIHNEIDIDTVHKFLIGHLPEGKHDQETASEIIARILKF